MVLMERGRTFFDEIALFTNGSRLNAGLSRQLAEAGLSYLCYSRHHYRDDLCQRIMGKEAPRLEKFIESAAGLTIRATCVMARGWIDSPGLVDEYIEALSSYGIREFTFKHTYVAYSGSLFAASPANAWSREHQIECDPFDNRGIVVGRLPWGPKIRKINSYQVCYYFEPTPAWELENRLCRSANLLSDGTVYASLEDQRSRLFQLNRSARRLNRWKSNNFAPCCR
jgi:cyclic pyranopterin phosphate synthase